MMSIESMSTTYKGTDGHVEYLLTVYPDGTRELATRTASDWSWSAPVVLEEATS